MERIEELHDKYLKGTITDAEKQELFAEIKQAEDSSLQLLADKYLDINAPEDLSHLDNHADYLFENIKRRIGKSKQSSAYRLWPRIVAAASILFAVSAGIVFYVNKQKPIENIEIAYAKDIPPGKSGATLTLANGKKIKLADAVNGQIANQSGVSVSKTSDGQVLYKAGTNSSEPNQINTLSTARGETYILTLPDKTQVWLNAASSLTYSVALNERGQRRVKLSGEAYFQVAKDKAHPFVVETNHQEVKVLGTHFNVNSYETNGTVTTLEEGSVRVSLLQASRKSVTIKPGEQVINSLQALNVQQADIESALAWKDGLLLFKDAPLKTVLAEVSRWYDVDIEYRGASRNKILSGGVNRTANLSAMQKILKLTGVNTTLVVKGKTRKLVVE